MNQELQQYARTKLKEKLAQCTEGEQRKFKQMYAHLNLDMPIDEAVDKMDASKLDWAMQQVQNTLNKKVKGEMEGEICNREGCQGVIEEKEKRGCSCHINPPCSACTKPRAFCSKCGWEEREAELPPYTGKVWEPVKQRTIADLDKTKIDWLRCGLGGSWVEVKGVFPGGTTMEQVLEEFGRRGVPIDEYACGQFKYFGKEGFTYTYTND